MDLTQEELGRRLGVGKTTVCQWERGTRNPSYRMGVKAVSVLKKPFEDLFRLEGSGSP